MDDDPAGIDNLMQGRGEPFAQIGVKIGLDPAEALGHFLFGKRALSDVSPQRIQVFLNCKQNELTGVKGDEVLDGFLLQDPGHGGELLQNLAFRGHLYIIPEFQPFRFPGTGLDFWLKPTISC